MRQFINITEAFNVRVSPVITDESKKFCIGTRDQKLFLTHIGGSLSRDHDHLHLVAFSELLFERDEATQLDEIIVQIREGNDQLYDESSGTLYYMDAGYRLQTARPSTFFQDRKALDLAIFPVTTKTVKDIG